MMLLCVMDLKFSEDVDIFCVFYFLVKEKIVDGCSVVKIEGKIVVDDVVYLMMSENLGEIIVEVG